ncbi:MAG: hypothetical protein FWE80_09560 [Oscillospiraceae bacterium]|nr:hypothetical protein [Oscillospiraceae bacterium]
MIKKYVAAALIIALLLPGCTISAPPDSSEPATAATTGAPQKPPPDPVYGTVSRTDEPVDPDEKIPYNWTTYPKEVLTFSGCPALEQAALGFIDRTKEEIPGWDDYQIWDWYGLLNIRIGQQSDGMSHAWWYMTANKAVKTAVIDREGKQLSVAGLFYEDVDVLSYLNGRISYADIWEDDRKRAFTGYTALPENFTLEQGICRIWLDIRDPFFDLEYIPIPLSPQVSPYGADFFDVSWRDTKIPFTYVDYKSEKRYAHPTLLIPSIRFNNGARPELDAAVNAAAGAMIPALEKAGSSAYPIVQMQDGYITVVYHERDTSMGDGPPDVGSAAVPGGAALFDVQTGKQIEPREMVAGREWYYSPLTGENDPYFSGDGGMNGSLAEAYTPPDGSVYSDIFWYPSYSGIRMTLTQPDGRRVLMIEKTNW